MNISKRLASGCCVVALVAGMSATGAAAQSKDTAPAPAASQSGEIGEIIVTARKRSESLLNVPIIETAISGDVLQNKGVKSYKNLVDAVPGLLIGDGVANSGADLSLRGIGTVVAAPAVDQSVSLNIDGQPFTAAQALRAGMTDLAQAEILKGPQALFFGKGSTAGVISLRTADPGDHLEVIGRAGYETEAREKTGEFVISGPLTNTFGARLVVSYSNSEGYFVNGAKPSVYSGGIPGGLDPQETRFAPKTEFFTRLTLKADPAPNFRAKLKVNFVNTKINGDGGEFQLIDCPLPNGTTGVLFQVVGGDDCKMNRQVYVADLDPKYFPGVPNGGHRYNYTRQIFGNLSLDYDIAPNISLSSVTAYSNVRNQYLINGSEAAAIPILSAFGTFTKKDFTQEVRLTSSFTNFPVNFLIAGFYEHAKYNIDGTVGFNTLISPNLPIGQSYQNAVTDKVYSIFGQLIYKVTPQIELAAGGRYQAETHDLVEYGTIDVFNSPPFFGPGFVNNVRPHISSHPFSPELTATWRPTADLTLFGAYKRGTKSGGFNTDGLVATDRSFSDEKVKGGEIGIKSRLFNRSLTMNLSAYDYKYSNLQVSLVLVNGGSVSVSVLNAASATVKGIDFDATWRVPGVTGLTLTGAVNYNHGRYDEFTRAPCYSGQTQALGCNRSLALDTNPTSATFGQTLGHAQDLSGKPLVRAPDWTASAGFDYETPVSKNLIFSIGGTATYTGENQTDPNEIAGGLQPGLTKFDARASLKGADGKWEFALIGNNLGDKLSRGNCVDNDYVNGLFLGGQITGGTTSGPAGIGQTGCFVQRGREVWLRLTLRPFAR